MGFDYASLIGGGGGYQSSSSAGGTFSPRFGNVAIGRGASAYGDQPEAAASGGKSWLPWIIAGAAALVALLVFLKK